MSFWYQILMQVLVQGTFATDTVDQSDVLVDSRLDTGVEFFKDSLFTIIIPIDSQEYNTKILGRGLNSDARFLKLELSREPRVIRGTSNSSVLATANLGLSSE